MTGSLSARDTPGPRGDEECRQRTAEQKGSVVVISVEPYTAAAL